MSPALAIWSRRLAASARRWCRRAPALGLLIALGLALWPGASRGASPEEAGEAPRQLELWDTSQSYPLGDGMWLLPDPEDTIDFAAARAAFAAGRFEAVESERPRLDFRWKAAWVRVVLVNRTSVRQWRFWQPHPMPDYVESYFASSSGDPGTLRPEDFDHQELYSRLAPRRYPRRGLTLELDLRRDAPAVLYLKYRGRLQALTAEVSTHERFDSAYSLAQLAHGLFYGTLLALLLYNLTLFVSLRDGAYGYYVVHVGSTLFFFFVRNAHIGEVPFSIAFGELIARRWELTTVVIHWVIIIGVTGFFRLLFATSSLAPRLDRLLKWIALSPLVGAVTVLLSDGRFGDSLAGLSQLASFIAVLSAGIWLWLKRRHPLAPIYLTAWGALLLSSAAYVLRYFGVLPYNALTEFLPQFGVGSEAVLLSLALAYRVRLLQAEKARAEEAARRARADRDVRLAQERAAGLTRMMAATDAERRRVARDLHDGLGQLLSGAKALVERQTKSLKPHFTAGQHEELARVAELIQLGIQETRSISHGLHPERLDRVGLTAALRGLVDDFPEREGLIVDAEIRDIDGLLGREAELHLYRIAQEALKNAWVHGRGELISVSASRDGDFLEFSVVNDGVRFDISRAQGLGLISIRERCAAIHAELTIEAPAEGGAELVVRVPIQEP
ncbi:MAG: sensor histidine kinase [Polyangiaceae bacterium]